jgi:branched-chain amino acid transport system substrate-binding protein
MVSEKYFNERTHIVRRVGKNVTTILGAILFLFLIEVISCRNNVPIKIGFVGGLTGPQAELGVTGLNGAMLAVEQINAVGGIKGHPILLLSKDDGEDAGTAVEADKSLIQDGVTAIIGHMTSTMSLAALSLINREKILMISPTSATDSLTGIDDYFIRIINSYRLQTDRLADYAYNTVRMRSMAGIIDSSGLADLGVFFHNFQTEFQYLGGEFIDIINFSAASGVPYQDLAQQLMRSSPEGLLVVANAHDTAAICHQLKKLGSRIPVIACTWAMTNDLLRRGGNAVEGVTFCSPYDENSTTEGYVRFRRQFQKRFGTAPDFAALNAYEACNILFSAMKKVQNYAQLKSTILQQGYFPGLLWDISINRFGDAHTGQFLIQVIDGQFQAIDSWTPDTGKPKIDSIK